MNTSTGMRRRGHWRFAACVTAGLVALPTIASGALGADQNGQGAPVRTRAQVATTLVKYISSGSIDVSAAVSGFSKSAGGLAVDSSGNLYVSFRNTASRVEVAVLAPDGHFLRRWDPTGGASVGDPTKLAVGPDGLVYVRNRNETIVRVFQQNGTPVRTFGSGTLSPNAFGDIEIDASGSVYVISGDRIVRFNSAGAVTANFQPVAGLHSSDRLTGLAVAPDGSLYVGVDVRSNPTPAEKLPNLAHVDAGGKRLADPAPLLHSLLGIEKNFGYVPADVDYANDRLYVAGSPTGIGVLTTKGELIDVIGESDRGEHQVAVRGEDVYVGRLPTPTTAAAAKLLADSVDPAVGHLAGKPIPDPRQGDSVAVQDKCGGTLNNDVKVPFIQLPKKVGNGCKLAFHNDRNPCPKGAARLGGEIFVGGKPVLGTLLVFPTGPTYAYVEVPASSIHNGGVVVRFVCRNPDGTLGEYYEWKGFIEIKRDPSGTVVDAKARRPVEGAVVRLQFAPRKNGPFGTPGVEAYTPQINPETTTRNGFFAWDVVPGFWRLRVTAFGYLPFTSTVYEVPPERTSLKLALRPDPRQQARLIDPYAGRAGKARLGVRATRRLRVSGLALRFAGRRIAGITVKSRAYRTAKGVSLGTTSTRLLAVYPTRARATVHRLLTSRKAVLYRVAKATFTVRRGRVVGIRLGR